MFVNYYNVLDVPETASKQEITKAYRRAAMKWHPDVNKSKDATERMTLINEAYCILRDSEARARFDDELAKYRKKKVVEEQRYSKNSSSEDSFDSTYEFEDKTLEDWILRTRKKATQLAKESLNDLIGITGTATKEFAYGCGSTFLFVIAFSLIALFLLSFG